MAASASSEPKKHLFWKPGSSKPAALPEIEHEPHREVSSVVYNPNAELSLVQQRRRLPIADERRALLHMVKKYPTLVVVGHTG